MNCKMLKAEKACRMGTGSQKHKNLAESERFETILDWTIPSVCIKSSTYNPAGEIIKKQINYSY